MTDTTQELANLPYSEIKIETQKRALKEQYENS